MRGSLSITTFLPCFFVLGMTGSRPGISCTKKNLSELWFITVSSDQSGLLTSHVCPGAGTAMQNLVMFAVSVRTPPDSEVPLWMDSEPVPASCAETRELRYRCETNIRPVHSRF